MSYNIYLPFKEQTLGITRTGYMYTEKSECQTVCQVHLSVLPVEKTLRKKKTWTKQAKKSQNPLSSPVTTSIRWLTRNPSYLYDANHIVNQLIRWGQNSDILHMYREEPFFTGSVLPGQGGGLALLSSLLSVITETFFTGALKLRTIRT